MAGRGDIRAGRAFVELTVRNSALMRGLSQARERLKRFGQEAMALGRTLLTFGTLSAIPIAMSVKTFASFEDAMLTVQAVSESTDAQFKQLYNTAKRLGATTSFTATEVASLMAELGRAGFVADQIDGMTGAVLNLSRATRTEAAMSAGIMAASLRQFGLGADQATRVADGLTAAANKSFNSVESLGESLSYAGPVADDFGMEIEEVLALLGSLGNIGILGSNAGTALRRLLTVTGAEAEKLRGIFGVTFKDAAGNARPLVDVMDEINQATASMGSADRAAKFNEAFGLLGITGASALGKAAGSTRELLAAIQAAGGVADATAKKMDSGLGGAFRIMLSAIEGVQIALGEALAPTMTLIANRIEFAAGVTIQLISANQELVVAIVSTVAGVVAAGAALIGLAVAAHVAAFAIGVITTPLGLITAGLIGSAVAWGRFTKGGRDSVAAITKELRDLDSVFTDISSGLSDALAAGDTEAAARVMWAGLNVIWEQGTQELNKLWLDAKWYFLATWQEATTSLAGMFVDLWAGMESGWSSAVFNMRYAWNEFSTDVIKAYQAWGEKSTVWIADAIDAFYGETGGPEAVAKRKEFTDTLRETARNQGEKDRGEGGIDSRAAAERGRLERERKAAQDRIEANRVGTQAILDEDKQAAYDKLNASRDEAMAAKREAIEKAQAALDSARDAAAAALAAKNARDADKKAEAAAAIEAGKNAANTGAGGSSIGSYSAAALIASAGGGPQKQMQRTLDETKKLHERELEKLDKMIKVTESMGAIA